MRCRILGFSLADQSLSHSKSLGILNVSLGLLPALAARTEFSKIVAFSNSSLSLPSGVEAEMHDAVATNRLARVTWDQFGVYRAAKKHECEWLLLMKGFSSFLSRPPVKLAVYVHDAMHDFYRTRYPGGFGGFEKWYFARSYAATLQRANLIFTNSEFTASEVRRMAQKLGLTPPRTVVAGIGFEAPATAEPTIPKEDIIMVPVSVWPHKLSSLAVEWLSRWQAETSYAGTVQLVGSLPKSVILPTHANWKHSARLDSTAYSQMLRRSRTLIYFSEYEGFGMPPIEAVVNGVAPVYSRIPAMMETSAGCGFPFANDDYESFASSLNAALACPPLQLESWARILLERYRWTKVVERVAKELGEGGG